MTHFHFTYDPNVSLAQRLGFELAAAIWSEFLTDDVTINLHIVATDNLNDGKAVGGAIPLFSEQHYGVYQEYAKQDATSEEDNKVIATQQTGNTVDVLIGDEVVDGNSTILLTSAQTKALGMEERLKLENGTTWDRGLVDSNALDGYILINNSYDWSYDFTRQGDVPEEHLDFLTMALHEIGHTLGFVSGLDGLLDVVERYSGKHQVEGFTPLDLLRYTDASQSLTNPDGKVADLTIGAKANFALDGETELATFSTGQDTTLGGDGYQASHWERFKNALGIMDPTLGYQERTNISRLDLQAFDVLGWDVDYSILEQGLDLQHLYNQALQAVGADFGLDSSALETAIANNDDSYTLGYSRWWQDFAEHMVALGYDDWWEEFEDAVLDLGYSRWWQALEQPMQELGYSRWWQAFEELALDLGYSRWWQDFEGDMQELGYSRWWQGFETKQALSLGYSRWWQDFEDHMAALGYSRWWQDFEADVMELGYSRWWQALEQPIQELGYSRWWQAFEDLVIELGYSRWWQDFESNMSELGYSRWWQGFAEQVLELGYSRWWQSLDPFLTTLDKVDGQVTDENSQVASGGVGGTQTEIFYGGVEDDIIAGDAKQDRINAGNGDDLLDGKAGHDVLWGEGGHDLIYGHQGNDLLYGGDGDDLLMGEDGEDTLHGEAGHDILSGGQDDDILKGGDGRDDLKGGSGRDVLSGDGGSDRLDGETGNDIVIGGEGQDQVNGGSGHDLLYGDTYFGDETLNQLRAWLKQAPLETNADTTVEAPDDIALNSIRVEAEDMTLSGSHALETWSASSGNAVDNTVIDQGDLAATTVFDGPAGNYMVLARYYDRDSSVQSLTFSLNDALINTFVADQNTERFYTQTVAQNISLKSGDTWAIAATSDASAQAAFDYLEFVPLDNLLVTELEPELVHFPDNNPLSGPFLPPALRVEAEYMTLAGEYDVAIDEFASDNALIQLSVEGEGKAFTTFHGDTGFYDIVVGYYDENYNGAGQISAALDGIELDAWYLDKNLGPTIVGADNLLTRTVASGVTLSTGDIFELAGLTGQGHQADYEATRIDYVDFIKVDAPQLAQIVQTDEDPVTGQGPVAHWTFDEISGTIATDQTGVHPATLKNTVTDDTQWVAGAVDGALQLDGVGDYVTFSSSDDINLGIHGQRSMGLWFRVNDAAIANRKQVIYEEGGLARGLNIYIHDGNLYVGGWNRESSESNWAGTFLKTDQIVSGQWHHVALVLDGGSEVSEGALTGYLDGEVFGVGAGSQLWQHAGNNAFGAIRFATRFHDGEFIGTSEHGFAGRIDDVYVYNKALNDDEIRDWMGRDNDRIQGGAGNDIAFGGAGNDLIYGESITDSSSVNLVGSQSYNDHTYLLSQVGSWEEAQAEARRLGGNLVTINDAEEEIWLQEVFGTQELYWTGFTDVSQEGQWEWISGEESNYTNWAPGEPNNLGDSQNYGTINFNDQWDDAYLTGNHTWNGTKWVWREGLRGIIELNATYNDVLVGGIGQDTLYGNAGNDTLYGDDILNELDDIPSESNSPLTDGLVAHWAFDDTSDSVASDTTGNHSGALIDMGSDPWTLGLIDGALTFDGKDDYVEVPDSAALDITDTLTLATWLKADSFQDWDGLIIKGESSSGYGLDLKQDGRLTFWANYGSLEGDFSGGDWESKTKLNTGDWHHVAVTYDGSEIKFYIDGQLEVDNVNYADITFGTNDESLIIGADLAGGSFFEGAMDDARVYDRALDAAEIIMLADPQYSAISSNAISENGGRDRLIGGVGNDDLIGGAGNDTLNGTDTIAIGYFEQDILSGGTGADRFILGDASNVYYQGMGDRDYALIQDFDSAEDRLQLHGSASNYSQLSQGSELYLYYDENGSDLVAILEQNTTVDLNSIGVFV